MHVPVIFHDENQKRAISTSKDPKNVPFVLQREYVKALNFTKTERILAKPFLFAYNDPPHGISRLSIEKNSNNLLVSSLDGSLFLYDLKNQKNYISKMKAETIINGISFAAGNIVYSQRDNFFMTNKTFKNELNTYTACGNVNYLSANDEKIIAASSCGLEIFDCEYSQTTNSLNCSGSDYCTFNKDYSLIGACEAGDLILFDYRTEKCFLRQKIGVRSNCLAFSDKNYFVSGNENGNVYMHDLRRENFLYHFRNHASAVNSIDFSGNLFASGSQDKTVRIYNVLERKCKDVYFNRRMNFVNATVFSNDGNKIISGSADGSVRVWKTMASAKENYNRAEKASLKAGQLLKSKFAEVAEIKRIDKHRFLPKDLKHKLKIKYEMGMAAQRREDKLKEKEQLELDENEDEKDLLD